MLASKILNLVKPALGMPALKILNFVKSALGMPALPPVPKRTTLVKFFKLDVDFGFFIFSELDPYKTREIGLKGKTKKSYLQN